MTNSSLKVALVVGGGRGMGAAAARRLAADGHHVAILSPSGAGEALAKELRGIGVTGSNQSEADLTRLVDAAVERWGRADVLVNSAGHGPKGDLLALTDEQWHEAFATYFLNVVRATRIVTPIMVDQGSGSIVNVSSLAAVEPNPDFPTSSVVRAGLGAYTKLFAERYAKDGVRMNNVLPGFIDSFPENPKVVAGIPAGRYGTVDEVASLIGYLASDDAAYVTGQSIRVDGGLGKSL